jgi:ubiquinone/menaquinone biosynthesis C-methylase UbiE
MTEEYVTEAEYQNLFTTLKRAEVAGLLQVGKKVLDVATGSGYFAIELARHYPHVHITGIDIFTGSIDQANINVAEMGLEERIHFIRMDACELEFPDNCFDTVVNYLGFEDIYMTRDFNGVVRAMREVYRVLKPDGRFYFVAMPVDEMDTQPQKLEVEVFSWICNADWLTSREYFSILSDAGFVFIAKTSFLTGKKLTSEQAKKEIKYACLNAPIDYRVDSRSFQDTWNKFGSLIEKHGMGHYSKTVLFEMFKPSKILG